MKRQLRMFKSKIHRAIVTEADLDYEVSLTVDAVLMEAAAIHNWEEVHVWDVTNGNRRSTYAIVGGKGSGTVCVNGAAAHLVHPGDTVIIATFELIDEAEAKEHSPREVLVNEFNRIRDVGASETPGPERPIVANGRR